MKKLTLLSLLFLTLFACRKDIDETISSETTEIEVTNTIVDYEAEVRAVTATLFGTVKDENDQPMEGASVKLDDNTTTTDERGHFVFKEVSMNGAGTFVEVNRNGYFDGSHRFFPKESSVNYANITMLTETNIGSFVSTDGGLISSPEGIQLEFPANSIVNASGTTYEGTVEVAARWIDPTADNLLAIMPGGLQGIDENVEEVALASYGMMAVELESASGEALNLGNNLKATLTFPVPAELMADAPSEIPLWYFSDTYGIWVQEGSATLQGDQYVGDVAHFSFWNCDYPYPLIELSGTIVTDQGVPVVNAWVELTMTNGFSAWGSTDDNGVFSGKVPKNEEFVMTIAYYNACGDIYTDNIGPFATDTDLGIITVGLTNDLMEITGDFVDCDGDPLVNGWVEVTLGSNYPRTYYISDGTLEIALLNCDNETNLTVLAISPDDLEQSDLLSFTVTDPLDLGEVSACGNVLPEFLMITIDGVTTTFVDVGFTAGGPDSTWLSAYGGSLGGDFNISLGLDEISAAGTYGDIVQYGSMFLEGTANTYWLQCGPQGGDCGFDEIIITEFGAIGEEILGTFSGEAEFTDGNNQMVLLPFDASFKIIRD